MVIAHSILCYFWNNVNVKTSSLHIIRFFPRSCKMFKTRCHHAVAYFSFVNGRCNFLDLNPNRVVELWYLGKKVAKEGFRLDSGLDFFYEEDFLLARVE